MYSISLKRKCAQLFIEMNRSIRMTKKGRGHVLTDQERCPWVLGLSMIFIYLHVGCEFMCVCMYVFQVFFQECFCNWKSNIYKSNDTKIFILCKLEKMAPMINYENWDLELVWGGCIGTSCVEFLRGCSRLYISIYLLFLRGGGFYFYL